jgi:hypothetical protein
VIYTLDPVCIRSAAYLGIVDGSAEWNAYQTYPDTGPVDFSDPDWPNDYLLTLQDFESVEHGLSTHGPDAASHHLRSVPPVDTPIAPDVLDPSLPFLAGVLMSPTTAGLELNVAPLPPQLALELALNKPFDSPSEGLSASSGVPQLPGAGSDVTLHGLNQGSSAEKWQSQYVTVTPREGSLRFALTSPFQATQIDFLQVPDVRGLFRQKGNPGPSHARAEARCAIRWASTARRTSLPNPGMQEVSQRKGLQAARQAQ